MAIPNITKEEAKQIQREIDKVRESKKPKK
jgi:hypothetical protein